MKRLLVSSVLFMLVFCLMSPLAFGQQIKKHIFPQIVWGGGYQIDIKVTNVMSDYTQPALSFFSADGTGTDATAMYVPFKRVTGETVMASAFGPAAIPGKGSWKMTLPSTGELKIGFLSMLIPQDAQGRDIQQVEIVCNYLPNGSIIGQAQVPEGILRTAFGFSADYSAGLNQDTVDTGVAIVNANRSSANVNFIVRNAAGQVVTTGSRVIGLYSQLSVFVSELAPEIKSMTLAGGVSIEVTSDQSLAAITLKTTLSKDGIFSFSTGNVFALPPVQ